MIRRKAPVSASGGRAEEAVTRGLDSKLEKDLVLGPSETECFPPITLTFSNSVQTC